VHAPCTRWKRFSAELSNGADLSDPALTGILSDDVFVIRADRASVSRAECSEPAHMLVFEFPGILRGPARASARPHAPRRWVLRFDFCYPLNLPPPKKCGVQTVLCPFPLL
jgi:hypothetical protein